jgi:hypothetical protein
MGVDRHVQGVGILADLVSRTVLVEIGTVAGLTSQGDADEGE